MDMLLIWNDALWPGFCEKFVCEKLVAIQKYFITSMLSSAWDSNILYAMLFIWHFIFIMF